MFVDIDLQQGVVRMYGQFIVIRECYDVVSEFPVGFIGLGGPILAFVQDALHTRMRVEVGPFPTKCRVFPSPLVGIENVRAAEWFGFAEIVYGAYTCHKDCQKSDQYVSATTVLPNAAKIFRSKEIRVRSLGRKAFFINNQC